MSGLRAVSGVCPGRAGRVQSPSHCLITNFHAEEKVTFYFLQRWISFMVPFIFFNVNTLCKKNKSQIIQKRREKEEKRPLTADRHRRQTDTESHSGDPLRMRATRTPGFRFTKTRSCYAFNRRCFLLPSPCSEDMFLRKTCDSATSLVIAYNGMTVFQHASTVPR